MVEPVETAVQVSSVGAEIRALIDRGSGHEAVALADGIRGHEVPVTHLRAYAYTEAGEALGESALVATGARLWRSLEGKTLDWAYNLGNAELALFDIALEDTTPAKAFADARHHVHEARSNFQRAHHDTSLTNDVRLQALTNLGNSYSQMGRHIEAVEAWEHAFAIDPDFAMARANVAVALEGTARFMGPHVSAVIHDAAFELDRALERRDDLLRYGGQSALSRFEALRARLPADPTPHRHEVAQWDDHHLEWCRKNELFLHVSHRCLREDTPILDPLFFHSLSGGFDARDERWADRLFDAYNALKQGYVSARYLIWLGTESRAEAREALDTVRNRGVFYDTHLGSRFGLRTGIALQAFVAAANVLDQIAVFIHLYFETGRSAKSISFRDFWGAKTTIDPIFVSWLTEERFNLGLYALIDLAADLEHDSPLGHLIGRRHTLTHRFLVTGDFLDGSVSNDEALNRLDWESFVHETISVLKVARSALVYATRAVDAAEAHRRSEHDGLLVELPMAQLEPPSGTPCTNVTS